MEIGDLKCEVYPDSSSVVLGEELMDVSLDDAGLPAAQLPNHQHLEDVLRVRVRRGRLVHVSYSTRGRRQRLAWIDHNCDKNTSRSVGGHSDEMEIK